MQKNKSPLLRIRASELAGYIGKNEYVSKDVLVLKLWRKTDNESLQKALKRNSLIFEELNTDNYNKESGTNRYQYNKYKNSAINTKNGLDNELSAITMFENLYNVVVNNKNDQIYKTFINKQDNLIIHNIILNGAVDGIVDNKSIVEVKNRQNKFFDDVPIYERIQILAYMKLTNLYECYHVQKFKNDITVTEVKYDKESFYKEWKNIETGLISFIEYFEKIYFSINFQDLFLHKRLELDGNTNERVISDLGIIIKRDPNIYKNKFNKNYIILFIIFFIYNQKKLK